MNIIKENPLLVLLLGITPALAMTTTFENALIVGICVLFILVLSNFLISLIKVKAKYELVTNVLITSLFTTLISYLLYTNYNNIYDLLGIYLPLMCISSVILTYPFEKEKVLITIKKSFKTGIYYLITLLVIATFREVIGTNTITFMNHLSDITGYEAIYQVFPNNNLISFSILVQPAGAFLVLGILIMLVRKIGGKNA